MNSFGVMRISVSSHMRLIQSEIRFGRTASVNVHRDFWGVNDGDRGSYGSKRAARLAAVTEGTAKQAAEAEVASMHVLVFATRDSCVLLSCWLGWASHWLATDGAIEYYQLHLKMYQPSANVSVTGVFRSSRWMEVVRAKVSWVATTVSSLPTGATVMFTDTDVVPLRPLTALLPLPHVCRTLWNLTSRAMSRS